MKSNLLIILSITVFSCGLSSGTFRMRQPGPVTSHTYRFLALGDSYTIGESVVPEEGWPARLATSLRKEHVDIDDPLIIAKTGWTTDELEAAIDRWKPEGRFDLVTLLIGVNNQYRGRGEDEYRIQFVRLLQRAVDYAGGNTSRVIVLSIPDWGVTPFAKGRDSQRITAEIDRFNEVNREETERAGARYVDITPISRQALKDDSLVAADGLHPSGKMYAEWTRLALPVAVRIFQKQD